MLSVVVCKRKRREVFIVLVPLLDIIANMTASVFCYLCFTGYYGSEPAHTIFAFNNFSFMMCHQIFGAQYFRTSLVLPRLFDHAKLEWLLQEPINELGSSPKSDEGQFRVGLLTLENIQTTTESII